MCFGVQIWGPIQLFVTYILYYIYINFTTSFNEYPYRLMPYTETAAFLQASGDSICVVKTLHM